MAAVHGSGSSVVVDVNSDVAEEDSNNQLGDTGNQLNSKLYYRATKGDFHAFEEFDAGCLTQLVTRVDKNTILHICITAATPYYQKKTARTENNESVDFVNKALAKCKELLGQPNKKGETILHIAARHGHHDIVRVLLTEDKEARHNGQAVNRPQRLLEMKNEVGDTALHEAVRYAHFPVVKLLISEDHNYQYGQNNDGETPLYIAAEKGACNVVREILHACESPAYEGPDKRTALHAAVLNEDNDMVELLVIKLKELTRKADKLGRTPLHYAAHHGYLPVVKVLLEKDKDAAYIADEEEKTALHFAASEGKANVVKELMLACPDCFEQVDKNGRNVLHFAVETNNIGEGEEIIGLVLQNECFGNLINAKDDLGNTPLHHAVASHSSITSFDHPKFNARVFNKKNLSPLDIVSAQSDPTINSIYTSRDLKMFDYRCNLRIIDEDEGKERGEIKDEDEGKERGEIKDEDGIHKDELDQETKYNRKNDFMTAAKVEREMNLLVATLIATVTFTAGLTMPGGFISDNGSNQGYAALIRTPALKVFVFSNTIAFILSSLVVFNCLNKSMYVKPKQKFQAMAFLIFVATDSDMSATAIFYAMIAMMIAFLSGTCAVLAPYQTLVTALCTLSASVFVFWFFLRFFLPCSMLMWHTFKTRKSVAPEINVGK